MRSFFGTFRPRSRRERFVVVGGASVSVVVIVVVYGVVPLLQRWSDREAEIALRAEQLARLEALVEREPALRAAVAVLREHATQQDRWLLEGDTPPVAASGLVGLLNRYAERSQVVIDRVDVARTIEAAADSVVTIPAGITARGDVYGLVDLLFYLQHGEKLLVIDDLQITATRGTGGGASMMGWTVSLHGYYAPRVTS